VSVSNVPFGTTDLFATRSAFNLTTLSFAPDRAILRRNVNFASAITPTLDFSGGDSFALTSAPYTIANANGEAMQITTGFLTANGTAGNFVSALNSTTNPATVYGVPSALTQNGDLHQILAFSYTTSGTNTSSRGMTQYNRELTARTLTLGAALNLPTLTSVGSTPYVRYSASGTWQSDYPHSVGVSYTKSVSGSNAWTLTVSRTYAGTGASNYSLVMPDFSGVAGFNTAWAMGSGTTDVAITASGVSSGFNTGTGIWSEGGFFRLAYDHHFPVTLGTLSAHTRAYGHWSCARAVLPPPSLHDRPSSADHYAGPAFAFRVRHGAGAGVDAGVAGDSA
jgi:hypothetical protein